jgi:hypothetical protein
MEGAKQESEQVPHKRSQSSFEHRETQGRTPERRALDAAAAGHFIAERLGLDAPLSRQRVWWLLRTGQLRSVRIGRRVFTTTTFVDAFLANGGTPRRSA